MPRLGDSARPGSWSYACYMGVSRDVVARELGAELRKIREAAGMSMRAMGERVGVANPQISMWENGHRLISAESLATVLDKMDVAAGERERLMAMLRDTEGPGRLSTGRPAADDQLSQLIAYERSAIRITDMAPLLIPGLLQTSEYSRAILGDDTSATLRAGRREVLTRRNPVEYAAYIDSEVLVRPIGPPDVMVDQLQHLLEMGERPNITIQLWQSTHPGWHPGLTSPFLMLEFAATTPVVHLEHHRSSAFLWDRDDVAGFKAAAEKVRREVAMTPEESARVIADIAHGMEST